MFFLITFLLKWPPQLGILTWHSRRELEAEGGDLKGITDPSFFYPLVGFSRTFGTQAAFKTSTKTSVNVI